MSSEPADREDLGFASPMNIDEGSPLVSPVEEGASPDVEAAPGADGRPPWHPSDVPLNNSPDAESEADAQTRPSRTDNIAALTAEEFEAGRLYLVQIAFGTIAMTCHRNADPLL